MKQDRSTTSKKSNKRKIEMRIKRREKYDRERKRRKSGNIASTARVASTQHLSASISTISPDGVTSVPA